ncbi:HalOD1 output domain-containing protein [Halobellus rufus]|uniref:HalOD1 output domain-containing protein n=1 Tax=Halobellus rufus TaxID=1448860 RepID=UPI00067960EA|nr:HalOD1 output domain-containing protein [Halobellus rufus]
MTQTDLITEVIEAVAAADGVELGEVPPLNDYIDPEILSLLNEQQRDGDWWFSFQFADHQVTVTKDSRIFIDGEIYPPLTNSQRDR